MIKYHKKDLDEILDEKIDSTERYFIKQIAKMVSEQKIITPRKYVETGDLKDELEGIIIEFLIENPKIRVRLNPYMTFITKVAEFMIEKAGYLHIKEYLVTEKQKSLDELFWEN